MKPIKKTFAIAAAVMTFAGTAYTAIASEDIPPIGSQALPQASAQSAENPAPSAPRLFSIEDYQEMNDSIAQSTGNIENSPALGTRYGQGIVDVIGEDEIVIVEEAMATPEQIVPIAETDTNTQNAISEDVTTEEATEEAEAVTNTTQTNPDTGAADLAIPLLGAAFALCAAPIIMKKGRK